MSLTPGWNLVGGERWWASRHPGAAHTVDTVIFTVQDALLRVLLVERADDPFAGEEALPGGFVDIGDGFVDLGEDLDDAAGRELEEETHFPRGRAWLEQLYTFGAPDRDPRQRTFSTAYFALVPGDLAPLVRAGSDARAVRWALVEDLLIRMGADRESLFQQMDPASAPARRRVLAFDHDRILRMAVQRIRGKIDYAPLAFSLVPETFTTPELQAVWEAVKGGTFDAASFRRRFARMREDGLIVAAPGHRRTGGRPAKVWRFTRAR